MLVKEITHNDTAPLQLTDTVATALTRLDLLHTSLFSVIDADNKLAGMCSLDNLVKEEDDSITLEEIELKEAIYVPQRQHIFEAARIMLSYDIQTIPVVDENLNYEGLVRKREIIAALGELFNLTSKGSVISVEVDQNDFTLSDMVRIIETEGARILGVSVQQPEQENPFYRISFKLNLDDSSVISAGLRRFGYLVTSEASSESFDTNISERADELIRYLDI